MKLRSLLVTTLAVLLALGATVRTQQPAPPSSPETLSFVAGELLISFEPWASAGQRAFARARVSAGLKGTVMSKAEGRVELATLPANASILAAIETISNLPGVQFAEPNWVYTHSADSNDTHYLNGNLWGMYGDTTTPANQFGSQAAEAWAAGHTGDSSVYVAVIDEGIDVSHPDLAGNIWVNPFDPIDGIDNDGNGYIDDTNGWDFFSNNRTVYDGAPGSSVDSHGTHVAGTIGAIGGNAAGVVGVNWDVTIISAKFLGPAGGSTAGAIAAVNYVTDLKTRHGLNIVATNNSWGGGGYSEALHNAIIRGAKAGILFIAAAGNTNRNNDIIASYPSNYNTLQGTATETAASYDAVIAVASITSTGLKSNFSSYGRTTVDLGAPGSGIASTTPNNSYAIFSGTSMATPHVTGAAALYASMQSYAATAAEIKQAILDSAAGTPTPSLATNTVTGGRLNIGLFDSEPPPPLDLPDPPSNLTATPVSPSQIDLAWTDGSDNETGFAIERCTGASCTNFVEIATVGANVQAYQNQSLAGNTTYRYRVIAYNNDGESAPSNIASATTPAAPAPPAAPAGLSATPVSSAQINLAWTDASGNETSFRIERCAGSTCTNFLEIATVGANTTSYQDTTGLAAATTYRYRVFAVNGVGSSPASNIASATTSGGGGGGTIPAAPSNLVATPGPGPGQITLTWTDNSSNESGFRIFRCGPNGCSGAPQQIAEVGANVTTFVDNVPPGSGTYLYGVRSFNAAGRSPVSNSASAVAP